MRQIAKRYDDAAGRMPPGMAITGMSNMTASGEIRSKLQTLNDDAVRVVLAAFHETVESPMKKSMIAESPIVPDTPESSQLRRSKNEFGNVIKYPVERAGKMG